MTYDYTKATLADFDETGLVYIDGRVFVRRKDGAIWEAWPPDPHAPWQVDRSRVVEAAEDEAFSLRHGHRFALLRRWLARCIAALYREKRERP